MRQALFAKVAAHRANHPAGELMLLVGAVEGLRAAHRQVLGFGEHDVQARDGVSHAAMLPGALWAVQFQGISSSQREAGQPEAIFSITSAI